jgi:hypothetical protein
MAISRMVAGGDSHRSLGRWYWAGRTIGTRRCISLGFMWLLRGHYRPEWGKRKGLGSFWKWLLVLFYGRLRNVSSGCLGIPRPRRLFSSVTLLRFWLDVLSGSVLTVV